MGILRAHTGARYRVYSVNPATDAVRSCLVPWLYTYTMYIVHLFVSYMYLHTSCTAGDTKLVVSHYNSWLVQPWVYVASYPGFRNTQNYMYMYVESLGLLTHVNDIGRRHSIEWEHYAIDYRAHTYVALSLRPCVSYEHRRKDCGKVKSHASYKQVFVQNCSHEAEIQTWQNYVALLINYSERPKTV